VDADRGDTYISFDETLEQVTFTTPNVGPIAKSFTFRLTVIDNGGIQSMDTCTIVVSKPFPNLGPDKSKVKKPKDKV